MPARPDAAAPAAQRDQVQAVKAALDRPMVKPGTRRSVPPAGPPPAPPAKPSGGGGQEPPAYLRWLHRFTGWSVRRWLAAAVNKYPEHEPEIMRLWDKGRAEARLR
jgi:hypothetical protein